MSWLNDLRSYVWVFPVGRGSAAFMRTALNQGFVLDAGIGDDVDPLKFVRDQFLPKLDPYGTRKRKVAQAILSHPHYDHIAQCGHLGKAPLEPELITCPHSKEPPEGYEDERLDWKRFQSSEELEAYKSLWGGRSLPLQTIKFESLRSVPNLEYGMYWVRPTVCAKLHESDDNKYGNATSIVMYYRHGEHSILVPGDITPEAMALILKGGSGVEKRFTVFDRGKMESKPEWHVKTGDQPGLKQLLGRGLSILVAPHHGLESCYCEELYSAIRGGKPDLVVLSEHRKAHDGDGSTDARYQSEGGASGLDVTIDGSVDFRRSVSTKNGHHILIRLAGTGRPEVWMNTDPGKLLGIAAP